ncbi:unnamed protein product [Parascedosporium putredinis]|uniref:6,7-dimethyl-8-ribityllumazine synthase n=1 Tax=Parascedosporium putredinis TaxID=1442378 RepID=A0A9P1H898_9PEZI|nr:unnamed protein product [Parascedosporium putredinis]CAI7999268.1 unnamed protein product [Parascedosporium putredinis]
MAAIKGPAPQTYDGTNLRVAIVHARWNLSIINPLVDGAKEKLLECGVKETNIVVDTVPGSWELPTAVQSSSSGPTISAGDLLSSSTSDITSLNSSPSTADGPFDAIIAIGVLIKGETMHFEYIADSVSHGLMRVQLDTGIPVIFGVLTVLTEEQAQARAGLTKGGTIMGTIGALQPLRWAPSESSGQQMKDYVPQY